MDSAGRNQLPRDRHGDERRVIDGLVKPAVLRRSTIRAACVVWLTLVVYGTLGPLGTGDGQWLSPVDEWRWIPPSYPIRLSSYNDVFTNALVYIPVGVALALLVRRRGGTRVLELALAAFLSIALSYVTELLQQFMPPRSSDWNDLVVNSSAALFGCLIAPRAQNAIRRGHELTVWHWRSRPWLVLAWLMTGFTFVLMTIPWDLTWPSIEMQWERDFDLLDFRRFAVFALLGFLITMAMVERLGPRAQAIGEALKRIFVCGVLFEACQIPLKSHACGLLDISTAFFGGMTGCGAARWLTRLGPVSAGDLSAARRTLATLALLGMVTFALIAGVSRIEASGLNPYGPSVRWLPFQFQFLKPFDRVVTGAVESLFLYSSLTTLCLYLTRGHGRCVALLLLMGLVGVVETAQVHFLRGTADVTPLLLAVVAWLITIRCWKAFLLQPRRPPHDQPARASPVVP
ncbi:MAG: VanZ family protein [Phycisphaerae bacterium]